MCAKDFLNPYNSIGVRLDNTFLMISATQRTKSQLCHNDRLAEAMREAAVSILITVLTDVLSFASGLVTDFRAVQAFSLYTIVAITFTFFIQLTFVLGVLSLSLKNEELNRHTVLTCLEVKEISGELKL